MITTIRKSFAKGVKESFGMIFLVIMIIGLIGIPGALQQVGGIWALKVNSRVVEYQRYMQEVMQQQEYLNSIRAQYGQFAEYLLASIGMSSDPKQLAINTLIRQELLNELSEKNSISINPDFVVEKLNDREYVQNHLADIVPLFVLNPDGTINNEMLKRFTTHSGITMKDFEQKINNGLARQFIMDIMKASFYIPEFDIKYAIANKQALRNFSYVTINFEDVLASEKQTPLSNDELKQWFEHENLLSKAYWKPELRSGIVWKVNMKNYDLPVSDSEVEIYYNDHKIKRYIKNPIKVTIETLKESDLQKGNSEATLVDEYDAIIQGKHQDLWQVSGPFTRDELEPAIARAAFSLQNEGDVSVVIESNGQKMIVRLAKRIAREYIPLNQVKNEIKHLLKKEKFKKHFVENTNKIAKSDHSVQKKELYDFIAKFDAQKQLLSNVSRESLDNTFQKLFSLKKGEIEVFVKDETGYIMQLESIAPSEEPSLESVSEIVATDIYEERAKKSLSILLENEKELFAAGKSSKKIEYTGLFAASNVEKIKELEKRGIPVSKLQKLEKEGSLFVHKSTTGGMIFKLDVLQPNESVLAQEDIGEESQMRKMLMMEGLVASLYRNATIETNDIIIIAD